MNKFLVTSFVTIACIVGGSSASLAHGHKAHWSPDPITSGKMDAQVNITEVYDVQPPLGWEVKGIGGPGKIGKEFVAPGLPDGSHPYVQLMFIGLSDWKIEKRTPDDFLSLVLQSYQRRFDAKSWKADKVEDGTINGVKFARIHFSGLFGPPRMPEQGFLYVGLDHYWLIEITGFDSDPSPSQDIKFAEATALSFVKVPEAFVKPLPTSPSP